MMPRSPELPESAMPRDSRYHTDKRGYAYLGERRGDRRYVVDWPLTLSSDDTSCDAFGLIVSTAGMLCSCSHRFGLADRVVVTLMPRSGMRIQCQATVVHVRLSEDEDRLVGLVFLDLAEADREILRGALKMFGRGWADASTHHPRIQPPSADREP